MFVCFRRILRFLTSVKKQFPAAYCGKNKNKRAWIFVQGRICTKIAKLINCASLIINCVFIFIGARKNYKRLKVQEKRKEQQCPEQQCLEQQCPEQQCPGKYTTKSVIISSKPIHLSVKHWWSKMFLFMVAVLLQINSTDANRTVGILHSWH